MKKRIFLLIGFTTLCLLILVSCSQFGPAQSSINCSAGGEVCIHIDNIQPFAIGEPMLLVINVNSAKDFSDLHVTLDTYGGITVDGPQSWENYLTLSAKEPGFAYWDFAIKAGQTLTFKRVLHFPPGVGFYQIIAEVVNKGRIVDAIESFHVNMLNDGAHVFMSGTPIPKYTDNAPLIVNGPGTPVQTHVPNLETIQAKIATIDASTKSALPTSTPAPILSPYPPPPASFPNLTATPRSSPYP